MLRDLANNIAPRQSLAPAAHTADADGAGVDTLGFRSAAILIDVGGWTDGTHSVELQQSEDAITWVPVADTFLIGSEPVVDGAAAAGRVYRLGYTGYGRYLRVSTTVAGATDGAVYGAVVVLGHPNIAPTE